MTIKLPDWLLENIPETQEPAILSLREDKLVVTYPDNTETIHNTLKEVQHQTHKIKSTDIKITPEVYWRFGEGKEQGLLSFKSSEHFYGMLFSYSDQDRFDRLKDSLQVALDNEKLYLENPTDFFAAYHFIDTHPAFWTVQGELPSWHWSTEGHCQKVSHWVYKDEDDGRLRICLETGSHVNKASDSVKIYQEHYHDYRLDVYADSFEQAFIQLAELLYKFFDNHGIERPDVEHLKPQWVLELEQQVVECKKWEAEDRL